MFWSGAGFQTYEYGGGQDLDDGLEIGELGQVRIGQRAWPRPLGSDGQLHGSQLLQDLGLDFWMLGDHVPVNAAKLPEAGA